jgi:hypothetical protein
LLLEADAAAEGGDVVIGGKECDQAKDHPPPPAWMAPR